MNNLKLLEINTRIWIKKIAESSELNSVPDSFFIDLKKKGIDYIWLMGIWQNCKDIIDETCFSPSLVSSYNSALKDWSREDVIGSPFSINNYLVEESLGTSDDLLLFKEKLNSYGIKLILDFVPNHFGASSDLICSDPELFIQADEEIFDSDPNTYFKSKINKEKIFAHGRDPLFPAWTDTIQLNYFNPLTREFMIDKLLSVAEVSDGVRCDMAMLQLNNVFKNTWMGIVNKYHLRQPDEEFWELAVKRVKAIHPDFIFIGEVYWNLEWELQQLGFDYTYDKRLYDRLLGNNVSEIKAHLMADVEFQKKSLRFTENHDEGRAFSNLGEHKSMAAAVAISTLPGMKLFYDGQFEGFKTKLPLQLSREPGEKIKKNISLFYNKLLKVCSQKIFSYGEWKITEIIPAAIGNESYENFLAWQWNFNDELLIVVINYSSSTSQCRIKPEINSGFDSIILTDELNEVTYERSVQLILSEGLYIELKAYQSHIFNVKSV